MLKNSAVIEQIRKEAAAFFEQDYSGHDMQHTMRVYSTAVRIAEKEGADMVLTAITALLHDVDDRKIIGRQGKTENAAFILKKAGVDREKAERICRNIEKISFRGTGETILDDPEGRIVQDADRLDAMGAIGIARVFAYAGNKRQPLFTDLETADQESAEAHFYNKLLKLYDKLNTETARQMGKQRHQYMCSFLEELQRERREGEEENG